MGRDYGAAGTPDYDPDVRKDPDDTQSYTLNWVDQLKNATISSSSWTVQTGMSAASSSNTSTTATVVLTGGTAGGLFNAVNQITTSDSQTLSKTLTVWVDER